ncbi:MAG: hypothetical protein KJO35_02705 [Gammaproteobacteria bacterium]|nr:hypothetical protein [Gammaproteobacteria bacterium]
MKSFYKFSVASFSLLVAMILAPNPANAALIGYTFEIFGAGSAQSCQGCNFTLDDNSPLLRLTNDSDVAEITAFMLTIGDSAFSFDFAANAGPESSMGVDGTLNSPDEANDSNQNDLIDYDFTGFLPARFFATQIDIEQDGSASFEDFEEVFWNNGGAANSLLTVFFSSGDMFSLTLPDQNTDLTEYSFSQSITVVPLPATLPLLGFALSILGFSSRRLRKD